MIYGARSYLHTYSYCNFPEQSRAAHRQNHLLMTCGQLHDRTQEPETIIQSQVRAMKIPQLRRPVAASVPVVRLLRRS